MASRRSEWIDQQVQFIHQDILRDQSSRILDLGCGPGLYAHRLAAMGHMVRGIDIGPASIDHAREHAPEQGCEFILSDIRTTDFSGPYDLVMLLFGEFNVFSPDDARQIVHKARQSLAPGGRMIIEMQTYEAVKEGGHGEPHEQQHEQGLFSDEPYTCRTECVWYESEQVGMRTFTITQGDRVTTYHDTNQAWTHEALRDLLESCGFEGDVVQVAAWPCNTASLGLWMV